MESIKQFFANDSNLFLFLSALMILYQLYLYKTRKFYNYSKEMERHPLNTRYHLNSTRQADLEIVNSLFGFANIISILISCAVALLIDFQLGIGVLAVLFLLSNFTVTAYLGKRFGL